MNSNSDSESELKLKPTKLALTEYYAFDAPKPTDAAKNALRGSQHGQNTNAKRAKAGGRDADQREPVRSPRGTDK